MSLVSEALRKARQEAAEREGRQRGIPRGLAVPPKRWRSGPGLALALLIALAAAGGGAAITWWLVARRVGPAVAAVAPSPSAAATPASAVAPQPLTAPPGVAPHPDSRLLPGPSGATSVAVGEASLSATTPTPRPQALATIPTPALGPQPVGGSGSTLPEEAAPGRAEATERGSRERTFVVDADLGHAKLHLDYVVYRPGSPFAGINGQQVMIGSIIEGFQVEEIGPDLVRLRDGRGTVVLRTH